MGVRRRVARFLAWTVFLTGAVLVGGLIFAYYYATDSATLTAAIESAAPRFLPGGRLVVGHASMRLPAGEVQLMHVELRQNIDGVETRTARVPWMSVRHDASAIAEGKFTPREVVAAQPTLRLRRRVDGTWNLQGLWADPWPVATGKRLPRIIIRNGTIELAASDVEPSAARAGSSASRAEASSSGYVTILRDVAVQVESLNDETITFEGSARGDSVERVELHGLIDRATGRITLQGDVDRLAYSESLRGRLPVEARPLLAEFGLSSGEVDARVEQARYDPNAPAGVGEGRRWSYDVAAQLRGGTWNCPKLPFPLNDVSTTVRARDGVLTIERAEGFNGATAVRGSGWLSLEDAAQGPLDLTFDVFELELDDRLRDWGMPMLPAVWTDFEPRGRLSLNAHAVRGERGAEVDAALIVNCLDVSMTYKYFKYPLEHIRGRITKTGKRLNVDLATLVGGQPLAATGTIDDPGPLAVVRLDFKAGALPANKVLFEALPPDIERVVAQFKPAGSVRGTASVVRTPPKHPDDPPKGDVVFDAELDLNEGCSMTWSGLPYPVSNLTGHLSLHPTSWEFRDMKGGNGEAVITGSGRVEKVGEDLKVDLSLQGLKLPFDQELRQALPTAWQKSWGTLNPLGSSDVTARILLEPGKPDVYDVEIAPRPETSVRLEYSRAARPGEDPGGRFDLRFDDVAGRFVSHNGKVAMTDVSFRFHDSPVRFASGAVAVEDSGRFDFSATDFHAREIRVDGNLIKIMPPLMAQFARRLNDGQFTLDGNLRIRWAGPGEPVRSAWNNVLVVLNDNSVQAVVPLEHLQGQIDHVEGWSDGVSLAVVGMLHLDSASLLGQQVTKLETPFEVREDHATLSAIDGELLGGRIGGNFKVSLDAVPRYSSRLSLDGADLKLYAATIPGRQSFRGLASGFVEFNGLGTDMHSLQGRGEAHISQAALGELPAYLKLANILKLPASVRSKGAFDTADLFFEIRNGVSDLDPIKFTGNAFSLQGRGTLDVQGALDLRLKVLYGRDRFHLPVLSDALRETSGQFLVIRVQGPPASPKFALEPLPGPVDVLRSIGRRREQKKRD